MQGKNKSKGELGVEMSKGRKSFFEMFMGGSGKYSPLSKEMFPYTITILGISAIMYNNIYLSDEETKN